MPVLQVGGVAVRLSLGLTYNLRVERDGKGDAFHHYLNHLKEKAVRDEEVVMRRCLVKVCFDKDGLLDLLAIANRTYFYERADKRMFNTFKTAFLSVEKKKKRKIDPSERVSLMVTVKKTLQTQ